MSVLRQHGWFDVVQLVGFGWIQTWSCNQDPAIQLDLYWTGNFWIDGSEGTEVEMTCEDLQFAIWILLDCFCHIQAIAAEPPSDIFWGGKCVLLCCVGSWSSHQLTRWGKRISQVKEFTLGWGVSVETLFIPWPSLALFHFTHLTNLICFFLEYCL